MRPGRRSRGDCLSPGWLLRIPDKIAEEYTLVRNYIFIARCAQTNSGVRTLWLRVKMKNVGKLWGKRACIGYIFRNVKVHYKIVFSLFLLSLPSFIRGVACVRLITQVYRTNRKEKILILPIFK